MNNDLQVKGFQELTEQEAASVDGGGLASSWLNFASNTAGSALNGVAGSLAATFAALINGLTNGNAQGWANTGSGIANIWTQFAKSFTGGLLSNLSNTLRGGKKFILTFLSAQNLCARFFLYAYVGEAPILGGYLNCKITG